MMTIINDEVDKKDDLGNRQVAGTPSRQKSKPSLVQWLLTIIFGIVLIFFAQIINCKAGFMQGGGAVRVALVNLTIILLCRCLFYSRLFKANVNSDKFRNSVIASILLIIITFLIYPNIFIANWLDSFVFKEEELNKNTQNACILLNKKTLQFYPYMFFEYDDPCCYNIIKMQSNKNIKEIKYLKKKNYKTFDCIPETMIALPFSLTTMAASVLPCILPGPAGMMVGIISSGAVAYRVTKRDFMYKLLDYTERYLGRNVTQDEWDRIAMEFDEDAKVFATWEANPDTYGNTLLLKLLARISR